MDSVGAYDAKTHLPALLDRVAKGEQITITRHGVPVARLVPPLAAGGSDVRETIKAILESRQNWPAGNLPVREMIEEGRR
jgi:prevent-host-death family protein